MPKLRIDQYGGYTIRNGHFIENGTEQIVRSLRVLPRAAQVFSLAEHHDAQEVPKELFYALLVEGDITSDRLDARPATVCNIPQAVLALARQYEGHAIHSEVTRYLRALNLPRAPFVIDHFSAILHLRTYRNGSCAQTCLVLFNRPPCEAVPLRSTASAPANIQLPFGYPRSQTYGGGPRQAEATHQDQTEGLSSHFRGSLGLLSCQQLQLVSVGSNAPKLRRLGWFHQSFVVPLDDVRAIPAHVAVFPSCWK